MAAWQAYQEEAATFFRSLGMQAITDAQVSGVRTKSDVDVLVTQEISGFEIKWIVECKHWRTPVSKLHVFGLREIVHDVGADRGIILCEVGFQSGAHEAANLTNVQLTSLAALRVQANDDIYHGKLAALYDRTIRAKSQYWEIPKNVRIACDLRGDLGDCVQNRALFLEAVQNILGQAMRRAFPLSIEVTDAWKAGLPFVSFLEPSALYEMIEPELVETEELLESALAKYPKYRLK